MQVELVSPEQVTFSGEAEMVILRTKDGGDIAFQPGHVPFVGVLDTWAVDVIGSGDDRTTFAVHGGFVQVHHDKVMLLSNVSELGGEINVARAEAARDRAQEALDADPDDGDASAALERANARLQAATGTRPA